MLSEKSPLNQLRFLTIRTLKTRYAGTALGAVWAFALPLMQIIIYIVVFGFYLNQNSLVLTRRWFMSSGFSWGIALDALF